MRQRVAGLVRDELGHSLDILEKNVYKFCWIVDFPMYEIDPQTNKIEFTTTRFQCLRAGWMHSK